jgi:hypothetical protein
MWNNNDTELHTSSSKIEEQVTVNNKVNYMGYKELLMAYES